MNLNFENFLETKFLRKEIISKDLIPINNKDYITYQSYEPKNFIRIFSDTTEKEVLEFNDTLKFEILEIVESLAKHYKNDAIIKIYDDFLTKLNNLTSPKL